MKLNAATLYGQSAVTLGTITFPTQTAAATVTVFNGCFTIQNSVTQTAAGATGKFWLGSGPFIQELTTGASVLAAEVTVAQSSAIDLTKGIFFSINASETIGHNITAPIIDVVTIRPTPVQ